MLCYLLAVFVSYSTTPPHAVNLRTVMFVSLTSQSLVDVVFVSNFLVEFKRDVREIGRCWGQTASRGGGQIHLPTAFREPFQCPNDRFVLWKQSRQ